MAICIDRIVIAKRVSIGFTRVTAARPKIVPRSVGRTGGVAGVAVGVGPTGRSSVVETKRTRHADV